MGETVTHKIDCWAFGCHLVALFFGRPLFVKYSAEKKIPAGIYFVDAGAGLIQTAPKVQSS